MNYAYYELNDSKTHVKAMGLKRDTRYTYTSADINQYFTKNTQIFS